MKKQFNIYQSGNSEESCAGISIIIQTEDYHQESAVIYNHAVEKIEKLLKSLADWKDSEGEHLGKIELEIRDYTDRERPMGDVMTIILQNKK